MVSVIIIIVIILLLIFFIFGCVFGQLWQKRKQSTHIHVSLSKDQLSQQVEYASSAVGPIVPVEQEDLEMTENVAYGPMKCTTIK